MKKEKKIPKRFFKNSKNEEIEQKEAECNHFMVWNIQGGYSYYRCSKCNYIEKMKRLLPKKPEGDVSHDYAMLFVRDETYNQALSDILKLLEK